jgi:hypothetical protein
VGTEFSGPRPRGISYVARLVCPVSVEPEVDVVVVSGVKGLNELGIFSHDASIIATKERAEMKMIEFFIARKLSLTALGIQSQSAVIRKASRVRR